MDVALVVVVGGGVHVGGLFRRSRAEEEPVIMPTGFAAAMYDPEEQHSRGTSPSHGEPTAVSTLARLTGKHGSLKLILYM